MYFQCLYLQCSFENQIQSSFIVYTYIFYYFQFPIFAPSKGQILLTYCEQPDLNDKIITLITLNFLFLSNQMDEFYPFYSPMMNNQT